MLGRVAAVLMILAASCWSGAGRADIQGAGDILVRVTGTGATVQDARRDAIRQALQQVVRQLVVVDRLISDNVIVRDKIISTMNGYVDSFVESKVYSTADKSVALDAEVSVAKTRILNFVGQSSGAATSLDGGLLNSDTEREIAQEDARGQIFDHLLRGFPSDAMEAKIDAVASSVEDPNNIEFSMHIEFSKGWMASLRSGLQVLSTAKIEVGAARTGDFGRLQDDMDGRFNALISDGSAGRTFGAKFCVYSEDHGECYLLPPGNYGKSAAIPAPSARGLGWSSPWPLVALRFLNATGGTVSTAGKTCMVEDLSKRPNSIERDYRAILRAKGGGQSRLYSGRGGPVGYFLGQSYDLFSTPARGKFFVHRQDIDLAPVKRVVTLPFFGAYRGPNGAFVLADGSSDRSNWAAVTDIVPAPGSESGVCGEKMDEAQRNAAYQR